MQHYRELKDFPYSPIKSFSLPFFTILVMLYYNDAYYPSACNGSSPTQQVDILVLLVDPRCLGRLLVMPVIAWPGSLAGNF